MAYYSIRVTGGTQTEHMEIEATFGGRRPDNMGLPNLFYVERPYEISTMRKNVQSVARPGIMVEVEEIDHDEFNWKERRRRR